ncbi:MAG: hypothetical protein JJT78_09000 [Leptospira sp.]|nr:hypothetical protein [Leptospira sp.]
MKDESILSRKSPKINKSLRRIKSIVAISLVLLVTFSDSIRERSVFAQDGGGLSLYINQNLQANWKEYLLDDMSISDLGALVLEKRSIPNTIFQLQNPSADKAHFFSGKASKLGIPNGKLRGFARSQFNQDFTLYLNIKPSSQKDIFQILTKTIYRGGMDYGLDLLVKDRVLELELNRFFITADNKRISQSISSRYPLERRSWNLVAIHFQSVTNTVILYLNGKEAGRTSNLPGDVVAMGFHSDDTTELYLGKDFYGEMKDFQIVAGGVDFDIWNSNYTFANYNPDSKVVFQNLGSAVSPVYKTDFSHSSILETKLDHTVPVGGLAEVWVRFSPNSFSAKKDENEPGFQWQRLEDVLNQPKCGESDSPGRENCFLYYQWKFLLKSDPRGEISPQIRSFGYRIRQVRPPNRVVGLKFNSKDSDLRNLKACMSWIANDEPNVWQGGSYTIHYGFKPGEYAGMLRFQNPTPKKTITSEKTNLKDVEPTKTVRLSILQTCVDNAMIQKESESVTLDKNLPFLRHGTTVYFQVSAENRFFSETGSGKDQRGALSKPIVVSFPTKDP